MLQLSKLIDRPIDLLKIDTEGMETIILEDVERSGKLSLVARLAIEFGLNESEESTRFSPLLTFLNETDSVMKSTREPVVHQAFFNRSP